MVASLQKSGSKKYMYTFFLFAMYIYIVRMADAVLQDLYWKVFCIHHILQISRW